MFEGDRVDRLLENDKDTKATSNHLRKRLRLKEGTFMQYQDFISAFDFEKIFPSDDEVKNSSKRTFDRLMAEARPILRELKMRNAEVSGN